jgi:hypothetical protein
VRRDGALVGGAVVGGADLALAGDEHELGVRLPVPVRRRAGDATVEGVEREAPVGVGDRALELDRVRALAVVGKPNALFHFVMTGSLGAQPQPTMVTRASVRSGGPTLSGA